MSESKTKNKVFGVVITQNDRQIKKQVVDGNFVIGKDRTGDLVLPDWDTLPHHLLFTNNTSGCYLHFTDNMSGEIKKENSTVTLETLKEHGLAHKEGANWIVPITGKTGWVALNDLVFIFGYSEPSEVKQAIAQPIPKSRAASIKDDDDDKDRAYLYVLMIAFLLHGAFLISALNYVPPPPDPNKMFVIPEEPKSELKIKDEVSEEAVSDVPTDALNTGGDSGGGGKKGGGGGAGSDFGSKGMLALVGSRGGAGDLADWGESSGNSIDSLAGGFGGVSLSTQGSAFSGKGGGAGFGGGDLGSLLAGGGGGGGGPASTDIRRGGRVSASGPSGVSGSGSGGSNRKSSDIYKVVSRITGGIKSKYETRLRSNPNLKGTVSVRFTIAKSGSVSSASIVSNSTGDPSLGNDIVAMIKRLNFGATDKGDTTVVYPFSFSKEQ